MDDTVFIDDLLGRCAPYLRKFKKSFANGTNSTFRHGIVMEPDSILTEIKVPKPREPKNMSLRLHRIVDQWFFDNFGKHARSEAFFCTSKTDQAKDYGFPFMVFPIGRFNIIHSDKVDDLFLYPPLMESTLYKRYLEDTGKEDFLTDRPSINKFIADEIDEETLQGYVHEAMEQANYRMNDFEGSLKSKNEIMVMCDSYYVTPNNHPDVIDFLKEYIKF